MWGGGRVWAISTAVSLFSLCILIEISHYAEACMWLSNSSLCVALATTRHLLHIQYRRLDPASLHSVLTLVCPSPRQQLLCFLLPTVRHHKFLLSKAIKTEPVPPQVVSELSDLDAGVCCKAKNNSPFLSPSLVKVREKVANDRHTHPP